MNKLCITELEWHLNEKAMDEYCLSDKQVERRFSWKF